jgi:hypothetical protein
LMTSAACLKCSLRIHIFRRVSGEDSMVDMIPNLIGVFRDFCSDLCRFLLGFLRDLPSSSLGSINFSKMHKLII